MNNWKVTLELDGKTIERIVEGKTYAAAYINSQQAYPDATVLRIKSYSAKLKNDSKRN